MALTRKRNEDNCDVGTLWQLAFLCLRENMMNTKTAIKGYFQDRCP